MKRMLIAALVAGFVGAAALATSHAGYANRREVVVTTTTATGGLAAVRASSDAHQYIGCQIYSYSNSSYRTGRCTARTLTGAYRTCVTREVGMIASIQTLNAASYIKFKFDSAGQCTFIWVRTSSQYLLD